MLMPSAPDGAWDQGLQESARFDGMPAGSASERPPVHCPSQGGVSRELSERCRCGRWVSPDMGARRRPVRDKGTYRRSISS